MPWKEFGIAGVAFGLLTTAGGICAKFLNGRVNHVEELTEKVFNKLDDQNREIGEVKVGMDGIKEVMKDKFERLEKAVNDGNNKR